MRVSRPVWWPDDLAPPPPAAWVIAFDDLTSDETAEQWGLAAAIFISQVRRSTGAGPTFSELFRHLLPDTDGLPSPLSPRLSALDRNRVTVAFRGYVAIEWRRRRMINFDRDVSRSLRAGSEFVAHARRRALAFAKKSRDMSERSASVTRAK